MGKLVKNLISASPGAPCCQNWEKEYVVDVSDRWPGPGQNGHFQAVGLFYICVYTSAHTDECVDMHALS